jgi:hypothetical protein
MKLLMILFILVSCTTTRDEYRAQIQDRFPELSNAGIECTLVTFEALVEKFNCKKKPSFFSTVGRCIEHNHDAMVFWARNLFGECKKLMQPKVEIENSDNLD